MREKAAQVRAEEKLNRALAAYWVESADVSPADAYQKALAVVAGNVAALPQVVQEADPEKLGAVLEWSSGIAATAAKVSGDGIRAGLHEREVEATEAQQRMLAEVVSSAMADIGLGDRVGDLWAAVTARVNGPLT